MSESTIVPKDYIEANGIEEFMRKPITSGRYMLTEWVPDDHYTIVPNPNYYGDDVATWNEVTYRPIPESSTRVSELLSGGVDVIYNVPVNEWERVGSGNTHLDYGETSRVMLLITRLTDGTVTSDPKVRQAIEMAIDKTAICEQLLQGAGTPTRTRVGSAVPGFNSDLFGEAADLYDPEGAKALLTEAGYQPGDITLTLTSPSGRYLMDTEMAQMIAAYLEAVGIHVNLELVDSTVMGNMFNDKTNKELFMIGLSDGQYDGCYPLAHYGDKARVAGQTDYDNPEVQELYQKALVESDPEQKEALEREIQAIAAEERPHICIAQIKAVFGSDNGLVIHPRMDSNGMADEITVAK
jgi:peptide/nickel transport system substrate-binding protein